MKHKYSNRGEHPNVHFMHVCKAEEELADASRRALASTRRLQAEYLRRAGAASARAERGRGPAGSGRSSSSRSAAVARTLAKTSARQRDTGL